MSETDDLHLQAPGIFFSLSEGGRPAEYDVESEGFRERLRRLLERDMPSSTKIRRLLKLGAEWFGVEAGYLTQIDTSTGTYEIVEVSGEEVDLQPGDSTDLARTYCRRVIANGGALAVNHASEQGWRDDPAYDEFGAETYLGGKIVVGETLYGTVCFVDEAPRTSPFTERHAAGLELVVRALSQALEREQATDRLRRTEARLEAIFEAAPHMVHIHDTEGRILVPNPRLCEQTGYPESELAEMTVWDLDDGGDPGDRQPAWTNAAPGEAREWEGQYQCKDGSTIPVHIDVRCVHLDGALRFITTSRDISEHKEDERALKETNRRLQAVLDTVDAAIFIKDRDGRYQLVNQRCRDLLGIDSASEVLGQTDHDLFPAEVAARYRKGDLRAMEEDRTIRIEETVPVPGGTQVNLTLKSPLRDESGTPIGVCAVSTDITERKEKEQELRRLKTFNQELVNRAPVGLVRLDANLCITYENPRAEEIFGLPEDQEESDAIGTDIREIPSVVKAGVADKFNRLLDGEEIALDLEFHSIYGRNAHVRGRGVPLMPDGTFEGAVIMIEDVSEQKQREHILRDRQQKVRSLYRTTDGLLRATRPDGVAERIRDLLEDVFDYPVAGVAYWDKDRLVLREVAVDGNRDASLRTTYTLREDGPLSRAYRTRKTVLFESDEWAPFDDDGLGAGAVVPIGEHGIIVIGEAHRSDIDSFDLRLTEILATYAALVLDHLEREEELVEARDEAERMNRMKSAFLANMSHEIRTPLTSIIGFAEVIGEDVDAEVEGTVARFADLIEESGRRLLETLDAVLNLSKLEAGEIQLDREEVELGSLVKDTVELRRIEAEKENIDMHVQVPDVPVRGEWNRGALNRILSNLLDNAIKFTPGEGQISVRVWSERDQGVIEVEDTGIGIEEEMHPHIFDPFKQESEGLTREYDGTGLGLSIVRSMVELLDGSVDVDSSAGEGTLFVVRLPQERGGGPT